MIFTLERRTFVMKATCTRKTLSYSLYPIFRSRSFRHAIPSGPSTPLLLPPSMTGLSTSVLFVRNLAFASIFLVETSSGKTL